MKIRLTENPYAEVLINLEGFKKGLAEHWDMEKAIGDNTLFTYNNSKLNLESLKTFIWAGLDWASIIDRLSGEHEEFMTVHFYTVKYENWKKLYPGTLSKNEIEFMEYEEDGYSTMLKQSLIKDINFDLKSYIKIGQFNYVPTKDKVIGWVLK